MQRIKNDSDFPVLNRWMQETDRRIAEVETKATRTSTAVAAASTSAGSGKVPNDPSAFSVSENGYTIDGVVFSEVTVNYTSPNDTDFAGVYLVAKDYRGSSELVKVGEHSFTGALGSSASFKVTLQRTGETVTFFAVAKNSLGGARDDWSGAPSATATLDGNVSAPAAPGAPTLTRIPLGIFLSWSENSESNLLGYNVYRNTSNTPGTATQIGSAPTTRAGAASFVDRDVAVGTTYYYWITAVNTANQESSKSAVSSGLVGPVDPSNGELDQKGSVSPITVQGNYGYTCTTNQIRLFWDNTNGSIAFTLKRPNNTTSSVATGAIGVNGLTASTIYYFYGYVLESTLSVGLVNGGGGTNDATYPGGAGIAYSAKNVDAVAEQTRQDRVCITNGGFAVQTVAAGSGGGTGGGSGGGCPRRGMLVECKTKGIIPVEQLEVGDEILGDQGWTKVVRITPALEDAFVRLITREGEELDQSPETMMPTRNRGEAMMKDLTLRDVFYTREEFTSAIALFVVEEEDLKYAISCEPHHTFYCGAHSPSLLTHNLKPAA